MLLHAGPRGKYAQGCAGANLSGMKLGKVVFFSFITRPTPVRAYFPGASLVKLFEKYPFGREAAKQDCEAAQESLPNRAQVADGWQKEAGAAGSQEQCDDGLAQAR